MADFVQKLPILAHRDSQIELLHPGAKAKKAVDRRQGRSQRWGVPEAGEYLFENCEIRRRPIRERRFFLVLLAGRRDKARRIACGPKDAIIERQTRLETRSGSRYLRCRVRIDRRRAA